MPHHRSARTQVYACSVAVLGVLDENGFKSSGVTGSISQIGTIVGDAMGGTSGALYR
jgi:hypothetical protein